MCEGETEEASSEQCESFFVSAESAGGGGDGSVQSVMDGLVVVL